MKQLIIFLLVPFLLNSQSEGGFGYRRFSNTTTLNNVAPSNINTSHSRNAYVHSNGLYYVWDGNSWEREHDIDTLSISGTDLFISLYGDGVPAKTVDLSTATGFGVNIFNSDGVQTDLERYFDVDSTKTLGIGQFPDFPDLLGDGTDKGLFYSPVNYGEVSLYNGNGVDGSTSSFTLGENSATVIVQSNEGSVATFYQPANNRIYQTVAPPTGDSPLGNIEMEQEWNDTTSTWAAGHRANLTTGEQSAHIVMGVGGGSNLYKGTKRAFGVQTLKAVTGNPYMWLEVEIPTANTDTSTNRIKFYNGSYSWKNERPSVSIGDTVLHFWYGDGTNLIPGFINIDDVKGSSVNIYNADGTQDDADRYFTIDSSRTFAMGQFNSFPASTWGRGFYYDPSNNDGIRILNKDNTNTTTTRVELDPTNMTLASTHTTSSVNANLFTINESAAYTNTTNRTSDTYGSLVFGTVTNSNEEIISMIQNGKSTAPNVSMYLGKGYASSQYGKYTERAWGVQSHITSGYFDWIQVLLPDTGTDTTGNNLNFYNRKYYWVNSVPSPTVGDSSVHIWVGNGTTTTPMFVPFSAITAGAPNIYNTNSATTDNTRIATITESIQWVGTADLGVDAYPFQIHSTGNEPLIQLWKGNTDSTYLYQSDVEYVFGSSTRLVIWPERDLTIIADSTAIQGIEDVTKVRRLMGVAASGYLKAIDGDALTAGTILKSDGTDFTTGDWLSTYSSATQSTSAWTANNAASNVNATIVPKGTGAFTLDVPDGGTGGGNSRGADAVDLQTTRDAATQVASGTYSGILAGRRNTASGTGSVILGGADNIASGQGSFIVGGYTAFSGGGSHLVTGTNSGILGGVQDTVTGNNSYAIGSGCVASGEYSTATGALARAYLTGQRAHAVTTFVANNPGFAQTSTLVASRTVTGTSQSEVTLDGSTGQAILLGTNRAWNFSIQLVGICSTVGNGVGITAGDTWTSWHVGGIKRLNTTTSLVGTVQLPATAQSDAGMSTTVVTIDADDSTEALRIRVTPPSTAGTTTVIRWVAYISLSESAY